MRPQDEILLALPHQTPEGQRFLLRRLGDLPAAEDVRDVHVAVRTHHERTGTIAAAVAEEAIWRKRELERLRRSVGEEGGNAGTWSNVFHPAVSASRPDDVQDAGLAAGQALEAVLEPLAAAAARGEDEAGWVARALGRIQSHKSIELLEQIAVDHGQVGPAVLAMATLGGDRAATAALGLIQAVEGTGLYPELVGTLGTLPGAGTFEFLKRQAQSDTPGVRAGVAAALEGYRSFGPLPLLDHLLKVPDPWVLINVVETLGRIGAPEYLQRVAFVFQNHQHPLIRIGCLQAISGSHGPATFQLAAAGLATPDPNVRAAAIEAMVAAGVPYDQYRDKVVALLDSPHPKLALNALLACVAVDPPRAFARVGKLLGSGEPAGLLRAIQCLAYIEAADSVNVLVQLIGACPAGPPRTLAVKSLGRLATRTADAVAPLVRLLDDGDPATQALAAWFLSSSHPSGRAAAAAGLATRLRRDPEGEIGVTCLEALGLLGPAAQVAVPDIHHALLTGPRQAHAAARALATAFPRSKEATDLKTHESPMVQGYGGLLEWFETGGGLEMIFQALAQQNKFVLRIACGVTRLAGAAGAWTAETRRLVGLAKALGAASVDAKEVEGLGRLDQSLAIPRKKIGLGVVPRPTSGAPAAMPDLVAMATEEATNAAVAGAGAEAELLGQSYYETQSIAAVPVATEPPPAPPGPPSPPPAPGVPSAADNPVIPAAPTPRRGAPPPTQAHVRGGLPEPLRWLGLFLLCAAAVAFGRFLKGVIG